jgi:hypothetical protein
MSRDLPADTDFEDADASYGTRFGILWSTDDAYEWPQLLEFYADADESHRQTINNVFLYLVGYTLPTLVEQAHGTPGN